MEGFVFTPRSYTFYKCIFFGVNVDKIVHTVTNVRILEKLKINPMKTTQIYSLLLDNSGSMHELREEMFLSINNRIKSIKNNASDTRDHVLIEIVSFNDRSHAIVPLQDARTAPLIQLSDYEIEGSTALYDALGNTVQRNNTLSSGVLSDQKVRTTIIVYTDGYENSSRHYSVRDIRRIMDRVNEDPLSDIVMVGCDEHTLHMAEEMNFNPTSVVKTSRENLVSSMDAIDTFVEKRMMNETITFKEVYKEK